MKTTSVKKDTGGKAGEIIPFFKESFSEFQEDNTMRHAAALAFYTIFSLPPLLILIVAIAGFFLGPEAAQGKIVGQIESFVGREGAQTLQTILQNAHRPEGISPSAIFGIIMLIVGATGVFIQLQDSLNTIWGVKPKPGRGFMAMVKDRFLGFGLILGVGFLLLVSFVIDALLNAFTGVLTSMLNSSIALFFIKAGHILVSFAVITLVFAMIYKFLPDVKMRLKDVWAGAAFTAILFTIGKYLIGLYLGTSDVGSAYGAAGSVIVMLVWIFYAASIFFLGAQVTQVYARKYGEKIVPAENAEIIKESKFSKNRENSDNTEKLSKLNKDIIVFPALMKLENEKKEEDEHPGKTSTGKKAGIGLLVGLGLKILKRRNDKKKAG